MDPSNGYRVSNRSKTPSVRDVEQAWRLLGLVSLGLLMTVGVASAQVEGPIGKYAVDVHFSLPHFPQLAELAEPYGLEATDLPTWGRGVCVGGHVYPIAWRAATIGLGATILWSRAQRNPTDVDGTLTGKLATVQYKAVSPQVSVNFGGREGWSYLSGGLGWSWMPIGTEAVPTDITARRKTINYGGGARWFSREHVGFSLDFRFYAINPQAQTDVVKRAPRMKVVVVSVGVSLK
jgi:hypothetical protein